MEHQPTRPTPGDTVWYQTDRRGGHDYWLPATVVVTVHNQNPEGLTAAGIPTLTNPYHVHLRIHSPGNDYTEHDVPWNPDSQPRTWRWPHHLPTT
jgi:hypothetical protein